ncbi:MAG: glycosyltransferase [Bacilli bacterium]
MIYMKKNPKVTIIIPVYNGSNYVRDAIETALAQTYQNLEIIVVNDGSKDDGATRKIVLEYKERIIYLEKENGGVSTALNLGIEKMTGDYFSWLSHDDMYMPNKIERQIEFLRDYNDNTILYSDFELVNSQGKYMSTIHLDHDMLAKKPMYAVLRCAIGGITLLIPKKAFQEVGTFLEEFRCVQDYELWFRMLDKYEFVHMPEVLAKTRIHSNQDSNTSPKMLNEGNWLWKHMAEEFPLKKKIEYEGSEYLFYKEMAYFLQQGTPYNDTVQILNEKANQLKKQVVDELNKYTVTVIIRNEDNSTSLMETINALGKQTFKNFNIIIHDPINNNIKNLKNIEICSSQFTKLINNVKTKFMTVINSGVIVTEDWLNNQLLELLITNKGMVISDLNNYTKESTVDNAEIISSVPFEGIIFDSEKIHKVGIKYNSDIDYCYKVLKQLGSVCTVQKFFEGLPIVTTNFIRNKELLEIYLKENVDEYELASLCYKIAATYNESGVGKKIDMYYPCNKYNKLLNSRSFKWYQNLINLKSKIRK